VIGDGRINTDRNISATMQTNTAIVYSTRISTSEFQVTVDGKGHMKKTKRIRELKYNDSRIFNHSTSVGNFTAQLAKLLSAPPWTGANYGVMNNNNSSNSLSHFVGEYLINKTLSHPSTSSPILEDAQQVMSSSTNISSPSYSLRTRTGYLSPQAKCADLRLGNYP